MLGVCTKKPKILISYAIYHLISTTIQDEKSRKERLSYACYVPPTY